MASRSLNLVMLIGNVVADVELKRTTNNTPFCSVVVATNREWTLASGEKKEEVQFHRIIAWSKLAEIFGQFLKKGKMVFIEGRLQTRKYTDSDGQERVSTEIVAENMILLGSPREEREENEEPKKRKENEKKP